MNKVELIGRLTADPTVRYTEKNVAFARFNLAVNDGYNENKKTYFINMVAWGSRAETVEKYLTKGSKIAVIGRIQTGSYEKEDGTRGYTYDIYVEHIEFLDTKGSGEEIVIEESEDNEDDMNYIDEDGLPF